MKTFLKYSILQKLLLAVFSLFFIFGNYKSQKINHEKNYIKAKIKGMYVYQFAKNIIWPKEYYKSDEFIFGFLDDDTLYNQVSKSYSNKLIREKKNNL